MENTTTNLKRVLEVNHKLNSTLELDELLGIIMTTAAEVMETKAASLMLLEKDTQELVFKVALGEKGTELKEKFRVKVGEGIAGTCAKEGQSLIVNDPAKDKRFAKRFDDATGFSSQAIICVPLRSSKNEIIGVLEALNPMTRKEFKDTDLELFEIFADQSAIAIENAWLHQELVQQEKEKQELKIAHEIQQSFLPELTPLQFGVDIAAKNLPAKSVGGDLYDVVKLSDSKVAVVIGDVSGKGVPAALFMVRAVSEYRFLAPRTPKPSELMEALNNSLSKNTPFGMFITLLYILVDLETQTLHYSSAGHHPILCRQAETGKVEDLKDAGGPPIGLMEGTAYEEHSIKAKPQDAFFLYTDGVTEARNMGREEYGMERLRNAVNATQKDAASYTEFILEDLKKFVGDAPTHDDTTVLTVLMPNEK